MNILRNALKNLPLIFTIALIYLVAAKLGLKLAFINASATAVWPPTGIAIASMLIFGVKVWPAIFLGAFFANLTTAGTILTSLGIASGNTLEGVVGAYLVSRFAGGRLAFNDSKSIFKFAILAGITSPLVSATIGVSSLFLGGLADLRNLASVWFTWWLGDAGGALVVAPLILVWSNNYEIDWSFKKIVEAITVFFILSLISWGIFGQRMNYPIDYIIFPVLLWVAFRFGIREVVTSTTILSAFAIWGTLSGRGPFVRASENESLLFLQSFMAIVTITKAMVASVVAKNKELDNLKDEFVSVASHELRTPMASIKGLLEMILSERYGKISPELKKPLNDISISTERLLALANELLDVSKIESKKLKVSLIDVDIYDLAKEVILSLQPVASPKDIHLEVINQNFRIVRADPDKVRQILLNLIGNGIKFSPKGGKVEIASKLGQNKLIILVKDNGVGIAKKDWSNLFKKFEQLTTTRYTAKPTGTGLGLFISQGLVKSMNGEIWVLESTIGQGTTFAFSLPLSKSHLTS